MVFKKLRKLPWDDPDCEAYLLKCVLGVIKNSYQTIPLVASLSKAISKYHMSFAVAMVDTLLEDIRVGLDTPQLSSFQKRIAQMKLLGELYNYKMIESRIVFESLYKCLSMNNEYCFLPEL